MGVIHIKHKLLGLSETLRIMFILIIDQFQCIKIRTWLRYSLFFCFLSPSVVAKCEFYTVTHQNWSISNYWSVFTLEDVSINNEYEYENDFKPYSYSKSFSQLSMLAMTPSSSL